MSRVRYNESDDALSYGRWAGREAAVLRGQPGQAALRELRDVLEAMPVKRLIRGVLCAAGEVCALGAWLRAKGVPDAEMPTGYEVDESEITAFGQAHGLPLTDTLGWMIQEANDDPDGPKRTPEQRHARMLQWVESRIK